MRWGLLCVPESESLQFCSQLYHTLFNGNSIWDCNALQLRATIFKFN